MPGQGRGPALSVSDGRSGRRRRHEVAGGGERSRSEQSGTVSDGRSPSEQPGTVSDGRSPSEQAGTVSDGRSPSEQSGTVRRAEPGVGHVQEAIARTHRTEWARVVATLTRRFGDLDIAEEAAAEAFATAVERWPADGIPPNPGAWLTTTANRKAIDRIRRENKRDDKQKAAEMVREDDPPEPLGPIDDDRLRLIFTCCHPALALQTRVALTLRMVGGLTVPEIARAFLVQESAMEQRITRAKAKIKAAHIPYRVPSAEDLPARVSGRPRGPLPRLQRGLPGDRP